MLSNSELELAATEADRSRAREIMDDIQLSHVLRSQACTCPCCDADFDLDADDDPQELREVEYAIIRGLVAHRLAATEGEKPCCK